MRIKRFNENNSNIPNKEDIKDIFISAIDNADEYSIITSKIIETGTSKDRIFWDINPLSLMDDDNVDYNGFVINLGHSFYNPDTVMYNAEPSVEDFFKYTEMLTDVKTSLSHIKEEYPNLEIRFDMSKKSWLIIQIKLF